MGSDRLGAYRLDGAIGRGGMGTVYRARGPSGEIVAIKRLDDSGASPRAVDRFLREASARIEHPNVVRVLGAGIDGGGRPYLVLEMLRGAPLHVAAADGLFVDEALDIVLQASRGLAAVHGAGLVHRDVKPANLFRCDDGVVKVLDFGVAGLTESSSGITSTGAVVGTPAYLSPEQARGEARVDARADVWALGVVLYELLTGVSPFRRSTAVATLLAVVADPLRPLAELAPELPDALCTFVERCISKDPASRPPSMEAFAIELVACSAALGADARQDEPARRPRAPGSTPESDDALRAAADSETGGGAPATVERAISVERDASSPPRAAPVSQPLATASSPPAAASRSRAGLAILAGAIAVIAVLGASLRSTPRDEHEIVAPRRALVRFTNSTEETAPTSFALSPDGRAVVYVEPRGVFLRSLDGATASPRPIVADATGIRCVAWTDRGVMFVRQRETGATLESMRPGDPTITLLGPLPSLPVCPAFSRDGRWMARADGERLFVRSVADGAEREVATLLGRALYVIAWSPDGTRVLVADSDRGNFERVGLYEVDVATGTSRHRFTDARLFSTLSTIAASYAHDGHSLLVALAGWAPRRDEGGVFLVGDDDVIAIARSEEGIEQIAAAGDGTIVVRTNAVQLDVVRAGLAQDARALRDPRFLAPSSATERPSGFAPDGTVLLMGETPEGHAAYALAPGTDILERLTPRGEWVTYPFADRTGERFAFRVDSERGTVQLVSLRDHASLFERVIGRARGVGRAPPPHIAAACATQGSRCVVSEVDDTAIRWWTWSTTERELQGPQELRAEAQLDIALSPDGERLAIVERCCDTHSVLVVSPTTGEVLRRVVGPDDCRINSPALLAGDIVIINGTCEDGQYALLRLAPGEPPIRLRSGSAWMSAPLVSPDQSTLVFGESRSSADLWVIEER